MSLCSDTIPMKTQENHMNRNVFTSPGCRLVILGGHPDLLDPVLGQLSGHSSRTEEPHSTREPSCLDPGDKKRAGGCLSRSLVLSELSCS